MDNPNVAVKETNKYGLAVFALKDISKGEVIAEFDGPIYDLNYENWTDELEDHVIQFAETKWRDSDGIARCINHSCEPNCGVKDLFKIVAMRNIKAGEEITWDYEMTEKNEKWRMKCLCGQTNCRGEIGTYDNMPESVRDKYRGYISSWLAGT